MTKKTLRGKSLFMDRQKKTTSCVIIQNGSIGLLQLVGQGVWSYFICLSWALHKEWRKPRQILLVGKKMFLGLISGVSRGKLLAENFAKTKSTPPPIRCFWSYQELSERRRLISGGGSLEECHHSDVILLCLLKRNLWNWGTSPIHANNAYHFIFYVKKLEFTVGNISKLLNFAQNWQGRPYLGDGAIWEVHTLG